MADPERELKAAVRRHNARSAAAAESEGQRDDAIRAAAATLTRKRIAQLTGLSEPRIYQIMRRSRI